MVCSAFETVQLAYVLAEGSWHIGGPWNACDVKFYGLQSLSQCGTVDAGHTTEELNNIKVTFNTLVQEVLQSKVEDLGPIVGESHDEAQLDSDSQLETNSKHQPELNLEDLLHRHTTTLSAIGTVGHSV